MIDIDATDFFTGRKFLDALLAREGGRCFYCLRAVRRETRELDHVTPRVDGSDNSYRNIVVSCHDCNSQKQGSQGDEFLRGLYRRGVLSQRKLEERLATLESLKAGQLGSVALRPSV